MSKVITLEEARDQFYEAISRFDDPEESIYWVDDLGRLHCDDAVHPAYDDMWDGEDWVGGDYPPGDGPPDEDDR